MNFVQTTPTLDFKPSRSLPQLNLQSTLLPRTCSLRVSTSFGVSRTAPAKRVVVVSAATVTKSKKRYPGEAKGFVEEMRFMAMILHTKDQAREGENEVKEPEEGAVVKWDPTIDGYLKFLVESKLVYDTLERIVEEAPVPYYCRVHKYWIGKV